MTRYKAADRESVLKSNPKINLNREPQGRPLKPLSQEKYGKLTPGEYLGNSLFECRCDCGWFALVTRANLETGRSRSCGCGRFKWGIPSETQLKFNFLRVLAESPGHYLCECICGNEVTLTKPRKEDVHETLSCGCIVIGKRLPLHLFGDFGDSDSIPQRVETWDLYSIWKNIKAAASRNCTQIDSKWNSNFIWFLAWAINQPGYAFGLKGKFRKKDHNIGYIPSNCEITYR